jgi:hypothetical protein
VSLAALKEPRGLVLETPCGTVRCGEIVCWRYEGVQLWTGVKFGI